jgi:hypothetical protein
MGTNPHVEKMLLTALARIGNAFVLCPQPLVLLFHFPR